MELKYIQGGDYLLPELGINNIKIDGKINRFGMLRLEYLKKNKKSLYTNLLMESELDNHLISVSNESEIMFNNMMNYYKRNDFRLSEKSKELNQMEWFKLINNYKNSIEETILKEFIYR